MELEHVLGQLPAEQREAIVLKYADDLTYEEKLAKYRELADDYFQVDAYREFCDTHLAHLDELAHAWFTSAEFDDVLVQTVTTTFPQHEHERFVAHYRGLMDAWAADNA